MTATRRRGEDADSNSFMNVLNRHVFYTVHGEPCFKIASTILRDISVASLRLRRARDSASAKWPLMAALGNGPYHPGTRRPASLILVPRARWRDRSARLIVKPDCGQSFAHLPWTTFGTHPSRSSDYFGIAASGGNSPRTKRQGVWGPPTGTFAGASFTAPASLSAAAGALTEGRKLLFGSRMARPSMTCMRGAQSIMSAAASGAHALKTTTPRFRSRRLWTVLDASMSCACEHGLVCASKLTHGHPTLMATNRWPTSSRAGFIRHMKPVSVVNAGIGVKRS